MKTVYDALKLLNDGHPHKRYGVSFCLGWFFEVGDDQYWLCEMRGESPEHQYLKLERLTLPRTEIHRVSLDENSNKKESNNNG
jgi:hypothetical protein